MTNHSNALSSFIQIYVQYLGTFRWCARCPGSSFIGDVLAVLVQSRSSLRVGYLRYFHGNLRAPTSSLGGIIKIDQKIHENSKNMAWTNWCLCQHKIASNFTLEAFQARFFFQSRFMSLYSHPQLQRAYFAQVEASEVFCFMAKKALFHRHGTWKFLLFQIGFWL